MKRCFTLLIVITSTLSVRAQGVFESNLQDSGSGRTSLDLSGYTRATGFVGLYGSDDPTLPALYSETALRVKGKAGSFGMAYTDLRFRTGTGYGTGFSVLDIREAYADVYLGKFSIRAGKQISPWGRADGWNPTDHFTPSDYFFRSPEYDDLRLGSLRLRGQYSPKEWIRLEADAVPWYRPSAYRFDLVGMPAFVRINDAVHPGFGWDQTSFGLKADMFIPGFEGSVSWFSGYDAQPALAPGSIPDPMQAIPFILEINQVPFRQQSFGIDFATILGGTAIRGEFARKVPETPDAPQAMRFVPNTETQMVVSLDRAFGPFRIIAAYHVKYVEEFRPADPPGDFDPAMLSNPEVWPYIEGMLGSQIAFYNRILFGQTDEWSHSVLARPSVDLFHETVAVELSALYNLTTEEYLLYPKVTCKPGDGVSLTAGWQYYHGGPFTRFNWIDKAFNGPFLEFRLSF